jgi:phosphatidylserine/phosphatidylglycerophosphate/cardiolipin synthase-like enzyme
VTIDIGMYSFTSRQIAQALVDAKNRNVQIRIVLDKAQKNEQYSKSRYLISNGIDVKYHLGPGLMHNKFAVIDGQEVITGSFNWTASAEKRNEENLLVITDKAFSKRYSERFNHLWSGSGDVDVTEELSDDRE